MQLIDALELVITPADDSDQKKLEFTWEMIDYTQDWIYI